MQKSCPLLAFPISNMTHQTSLAFLQKQIPSVISSEQSFIFNLAVFASLEHKIQSTALTSRKPLQVFWRMTVFLQKSQPTGLFVVIINMCIKDKYQLFFSTAYTGGISLLGASNLYYRDYHCLWNTPFPFFQRLPRLKQRLFLL